MCWFSLRKKLNVISPLIFTNLSKVPLALRAKTVILEIKEYYPPPLF